MSDTNIISLDPKPVEQCQYVNSRGRRCRMLPAPGNDGFCPHHYGLLIAERRKNDEICAEELLGPIEDFSSPVSVNLFLGNLLKQLVHKRIARPDALAQAYICQLLLNTFPAMRQERDVAAKDQAHQLFLESLSKPRKASPPAAQHVDSLVPA